MYLMPLLICGVNGTAISVVKGPVAVYRNGASPVPMSIIRFKAHDTLGVNG